MERWGGRGRYGKVCGTMGRGGRDGEVYGAMGRAHEGWGGIWGVGKGA